MIGRKYYQTIIKCQDAASLCAAMVRNAAYNIVVEKTTDIYLDDVYTKAEELRKAIDEVIARQMKLDLKKISTRQ